MVYYDLSNPIIYIRYNIFNKYTRLFIDNMLQSVHMSVINTSPAIPFAQTLTFTASCFSAPNDDDDIDDPNLRRGATVNPSIDRRRTRRTNRRSMVDNKDNKDNKDDEGAFMKS